MWLVVVVVVVVVAVVVVVVGGGGEACLACDIASPAVDGSNSRANITTNTATTNRAHAPMDSTRMPSQRLRNVA